MTWSGFKHYPKHGFISLFSYRYYDQLCAIEPKFPFSENQVIDPTHNMYGSELKLN